MKKKIIFVSHCLLNTASKVFSFKDEYKKKEEEVRKKFLLKAIENDIHIIQLPCPEFKLYGALRWGHVKEQFDNIFFRKSCREMLSPLLDQLHEYISNDDRFEVLGIIGINGSPSCGVDYTCVGKWFGELSGRENLDGLVKSISLADEKGVLMEVLSEMLREEGLDIRIVGLDKNNPGEIFELIGVKYYED